MKLVLVPCLQLNQVLSIGLLSLAQDLIKLRSLMESVNKLGDLAEQ